MKNYKKILGIIMMMLIITIALGELWEPMYIGGMLLGFLIGYSILFWSYQSLIDNMFDSADKQQRMNTKLMREVERLQSLLYFKDTLVAKEKPKKRAKKK